jgi:hypothetical protein
MKKTLTVILAFCLCVCLCACGKTQAATAVDRLILGIGVVTPESSDAIKTARQSYEALTEEEKNEVKNLNILINAENQLQELIENTKTDSKKEILNRNPNSAIALLEGILHLDPSVQDDIDIIYGHCFDMNGILFIKPSLLYTGVELVALSPHDSERELDGHFFAPIDTKDFYNYSNYAKQEFLLNSSKTVESSDYIHYEYLDKATGKTVLKLSLFSFNGELTIQVETVPQSRIHTS